MRPLCDGRTVRETGPGLGWETKGGKKRARVRATASRVYQPSLPIAMITYAGIIVE